MSAEPQKTKVNISGKKLRGCLEIKDLFPDIVQQMGPKQFKHLAAHLKIPEYTEAAPKKEDDDEIPTLVGGANFEETSKKE